LKPHHTSLPADDRTVRIAREWLSAIVDSSDDAIVSKDLNGIITSWNGAAERMFGYTAAEAIGQPVLMIIPPDRVHEEANVLSHIRRGEAVRYERTERVRKDGRHVIISLAVSPIIAPDGEVVGASKIARDITEQQRITAALAASEERQRDLQQRLSVLIAASGSLFGESKVDAVLQRALSIARELIAADAVAVWGYDRAAGGWRIRASHGLSETFVNRLVRMDAAPDGLVPFSGPLAVDDVSVHPLLESQRAANAAEGIQSMLATPLVITGEANGAIAWYQRSPKSFSEVEQHTAGAIGNLAAAAFTTAELLKRVTEADRAKDQFLAVLSHELRTPLNAIMGWSHVLKEGALDPVATARAIDVIESNTRLQARVVDDLLDVSRIIAGKFQLQIAPVCPTRVIEAVIDTMRPSAAAKSIDLTVEIGEGLPEIQGDAARLQQAVGNLLSNAIKFTPARGQIVVRTGVDAGCVVVSVADSGAGIPPESLPKVFDRFHQVGAGASLHGLGLGLTIVREIVQRHGGSVSAASEGVNRGATFTIRLPVSPPA
jgi:PAS domain S-box-containing protein